MDVYAVVGQDSVNQMEAGVYHYKPRGHELTLIAKQDLRDQVEQ